jgi:NAD+ synthase (glutamine-hydrolysing)
MKIGLAQINPTIGDLEGNVERCLDAITTAQRAGADLVVLPELAIPGCHPRDILYDPSFPPAVAAATADLAERTRGGPPVVVGALAPASHPPRHPGLHNAAMLLEDGAARLVAAKHILPTHDVFSEPRWFVPGPISNPIAMAGHRLGILFGDDLDAAGGALSPAAALQAAGAETLICLAASPYRRGVLAERLAAARRPGQPLVYANLCGGNDALIYDGRSFVLDCGGAVIEQLPGFIPDVRVVELDAPQTCQALRKCLARDADRWEAELFGALVLGVRDFVQKNGLEHAWLGLSGGIDSALVAAIATEALGPKHVSAVAIPSRYSDPRSASSAQELAARLGIAFHVMALDRLHIAAEETLGDLLVGGTTAENVQARLRAMILMSFVNHHGGVLLNTSNKTELALGYGTLYGDLAGMLSPIGDLTKPDVYALARWLNAQRRVIPDFILDRPPSAELKPDQVDPFDYPVVSPAIERLVQEDRSNPILRRTEYKRWSGGVILKVSARAFGWGRMMPITRR